MTKINPGWGFLRFIRLKRTFTTRKRIPHARPEAGLETRSKAGGRGLIFISPELGAMNNKLPSGGES
jgi:hypothetical protein